MTTSDKLREIAKLELDKRIVGILMAHGVNSIDAFNSTPDITALISEHYVEKEAYVSLENTLAKAEEKVIALLRQRDELREALRKVFHEIFNNNLSHAERMILLKFIEAAIKNTER